MSPATTTARDGLGPLFNTNGCQNCHIRDGRGHAPESLDDNAVSLLVRLSIDSDDKLAVHQAKHHEPNYGDQLQDFALPGIKPEGRVRIHYKETLITFTDGEKVTLRRPTVSIDQLAYGPLHPNTQLSARIAPAMIGLGLLEAIPESRLKQLADPKDANSDGISGKLNRVWDIQQQKLVVGRFGWKAGQPTLEQQNAAAFNGDIGITSTLFPNESCSPKQQECLAIQEKEIEVSPHILGQVTFYTRNLAVPARRKPTDPQILQGQQLFHQIGCASCHTPQHTTAEDYPLAWLADQTIHPYSDLLLHDMGDALADNSREFAASGREWRTPPLWGIGLTKTVSGHESYLHDGRARNLQEAILWHGGEADKSRKHYKRLSKEDRQAVLAFLRDL
ncbi:di-heme oxidoredictase family protein [Maricurvus nonylphenolicus]